MAQLWSLEEMNSEQGGSESIAMVGTRVVAVEKERVVRFQRHLGVQLPGHVVRGEKDPRISIWHGWWKQRTWSPDGRPGLEVLNLEFDST